MNKRVRYMIGVPLVLWIVLGPIWNYYKNFYMLSLNGQVESYKNDIKENFILTVSGKEYNLEHKFPKLIRNIAVGDSVIKDAKTDKMILIKRNSKLRYTCDLDE